MTTRFSIVIPTFDRPLKLDRAIQSCLAQSLAPAEVLIIDNGNNPKTARIVEAHRSRSATFPIRYQQSEPFDVRKALATGIQYAQSEWTILLDDDDFLVPSRLHIDAEQIECAQPEDLAILHDFVRIDYHNNLVWEHRMGHKTLSLKDALVLDNMPPPPAVTWRSQILKTNHPFNIPEGWMTDYDLYASLLPHGEIKKSERFGYVMDDTRVAGRLTGNITKSLESVELHRNRYRNVRRYAQATDRDIDQRLDEQIAFFAGRSIQLKAFHGETAPYAKAHPTEVFKGILAPMRPQVTRWFADSLPEMRGSKSYSFKRFAHQHPDLSQLIEDARLAE